MRIRAIIVVFSIALLLACSKQPVEQNEGEPASVEIREYEGQVLSSVNDFRENSIRGVQNIDIDSYTLEVSGLVKNPSTYTHDQVLAHPPHEKVVTLHCVEGWSSTVLWEGILLKDIFKEVQPETQANTVIFYAADGYSSSLPLEYIVNNNIMLAHKMNDVTLPPARGFPFQLVAEQKWGYKWVRWITRIELSDDPGFRGLWESVGYSQDGGINMPIFDR